MPHISSFASVFPYDPKLDSAMAHEHLVIAYSLTWFVHLCYLFYVGRKWRSTRRQKLQIDGTSNISYPGDSLASHAPEST